MAVHTAKSRYDADADGKVMGGYQALTEKEKQTLRLLVDGYDAKSMARHLGLSVHTINERLRDARRKMATSSSREAARLVRAAEASTPQSLGDKQLGDVLPGGSEETVANQQADGTVPRHRWLIGGTVMSLALGAYALAALFGSAAAPSAAPAAAAAAAESPAPAGQAAIDAARSFLALVDAGDWSRSYAATAQTFRKVNSEALWAQSSQQVYPPLGALHDRVLAGADFVPAPPDGSWIVKFHSSFAERPKAVETLSLVREDGTWKVTGIFVE